MSGAMAFLAGMGTGYLNGEKYKKEQERIDAKDKRDQTLFDSQMEKINQEKADRAALKYAGETVTARELYGPQTEAAYAAAPGLSEPAPVGFISGNGASARTFASRGLADANAVEQNKPEAKRTRMADLAMQGNTFAANALDVDDKQVKRGRETTEFDQKQVAHARLLKQEGAFDAAKFMRSGDEFGFKTAFNQSGDHQIVGEPVKQLEVRDIPGVGKVNTYNFTFDLQMPDGSVRRETRNSHDMSVALMPFEKMIDLQQKGTKAAGDATESAAKADYYNAYADALKPGGTKDKGGGAGAIARGGVGGAPGVSLKDRRDYLSDFSNGLEDPKTATDPNEAAAIQQRNQAKLVQADAIFSTNAEFGTVLTAPQASAAMSLAQDPKNVRKVRDNNTGTVYEVVNVSGKQVVVGTGSLKPKDAGGNPAANDAGAGKRAPTKLATQSGSHAPTDAMKTTIKQTPPDVALSIRDLDAKLQLQGVDPQIRLQWMDERRRLSGGAFGSLASIQQPKN